MNLFEKKRPRIIYNCDSMEPFMHFPSPMEKHIKEEYLAVPVEEVQDSQVDAFCWGICGGDMITRYPSRYGQMWGDGVPESERDLLRTSLDKFLKEGRDPVNIMKEHVKNAGLLYFPSVRMNDTHHKTHQNPPFASDFWRSHPEYRNWGVTRGACYFNGTLNYAFPEVRQRRMDVICELAENYDIDGIELDFGRQPDLFSPHEAWEKRHIATDFMKEVRSRLDNIFAKKGRDYSIIVRTVLYREQLEKSGIDLKAWMEEKVADAFALSCLHTGNDFNASLKPWVETARKSGVLLYGCIEVELANSAPGFHNIDTSPEEYRGMAEMFFDQGADGIYYFNFPCMTRRIRIAAKYRKYLETLKETGAPKSLAGTDKSYTFYRDLPIELEVKRPPEYYQSVNFNLPECAIKNEKGKWEAVFDITGFPEKENIKIFLNGKTIDSSLVRYERKNELAAGGQNIPKSRCGYVKDAHYETGKISIPAGYLRPGTNTIGFFLEEGPRVEHTFIKIYELQINVTYNQEKNE